MASPSTSKSISLRSSSSSTVTPSSRRSSATTSAAGRPSKVVARGTVRVERDAGTSQLPARAPTSLVDADGRGYTVYYQNQLPEVRVRWPNAPP